MKYLVLFSCFSLLSCNSNNKKPASPVRFDGVYQSAVETNKATGDKS